MKAEYAVGLGVSVLMLCAAAVWLLAPASVPPRPLAAGTAGTPAGGTIPAKPKTVTADPEDGLSAPERVAVVLERAQQAADADAEQAAAAELNLVLGELAAEDGLAHARALLAPDEEPGVHEIGVRLLTQLGSPEAAAEQTRAATDPRVAPQARLLLIYALAKRADDAATQTALWTIVENPKDDVEVRAFALGVVGEAPEAAARVLQLVKNTADDPFLRGSAYLTLRDHSDPSAANEALAVLQADPAMAEELKKLEAE